MTNIDLQAEEPGRADASHTVRLLGSYVLAHRLRFRNTTVGGLSGIDYDPRTGTYLLLSDDRSANDPARFYTAHIEVDSAGLHDVVLTGVTILRRPDGKPYPSLDEWGPGQAEFTEADRHVFGCVDPEEIRLDPRTGNVLWSQEGVLATSSAGEPILVNPALRISTMDGTFVKDLPIATNVLYSNEQGPRQDHSIESLTYAGNGELIVYVVEDPLIADGGEPTAGSGGRTRMTVERATGEILAQYAYDIDPLPAGADGAAGNIGVSSVLAWDTETDTRFLVLERAFVSGYGNRLRLYEADIASATNVLPVPSLIDVEVVPAAKKPLIDFADLGLGQLENVESMTWGPDLPTGERTLIFVSDDNFSPKQRTQVIALAVG